ncbi:MAG: hypothetical protein COA94_07030 [Rickettsiales bacterium]|nr:MAG: hypothetical protein COA94_07030 [Rickettsiales bacterium]
MTDFQIYSELYSRLGIKDTVYLAFRDIPELINKHVSGRKTLDFGCGAGRSARFLKELGMEVNGVDSSIEMITQAKKIDDSISYEHISNNYFTQHSETYDLVFSSFVFFETSSLDLMLEIFQLIHKTLKNDGIFILITGSMEMYSHNWLSLDANYPENKNPTSGSLVKIKLKNVDLELDDYFWTDDDYKITAAKAGFSLLEMHNPIGTKHDGYKWKSEEIVSPYSIYVFKK